MANEAKPCPCDIGDRMEYGALGQEVQIEHFKAYVVKPSTASDKAIIIIQDIFGWQLPNTRYMADMLAANGYIAICPDFFVGKEPWSPTKDWSNFQEWLQDKKPTAINKEVDAVLKFLKNQCGAKHVGVVGFCWGGVATHYLALLYPEIKAGVSVYGIIMESTLSLLDDLSRKMTLDQTGIIIKQKNPQNKTCNYEFAFGLTILLPPRMKMVTALVFLHSMITNM
uniref:Carboxymethylenebutenolidase homolog n=1 Tax=Neolamprologus brichardi TaxID=32507 RepID=A0A3Q4G0T6_NEOBR